MLRHCLRAVVMWRIPTCERRELQPDGWPGPWYACIGYALGEKR